MTFFHSLGSLRRMAIAGLSVLGLTTTSLGVVLASGQLSAQAAPSEAVQSEATQRLMQMFSPQIRATLGACGDKGLINLAGAGANGGVVCGDGTTLAEIPFQTYLNTVSDFLAASMLLGMREQMAVNPQVTPDKLLMLFNTAEGRAFMQDTVQSALMQSRMITPNSDPAPLANQIISKMQPALQQTNYLQTLLGTEAQYNQIVQSFCTAPGMPIEQAQQTVPGLSSVQLFAICVQESGVR